MSRFHRRVAASLIAALLPAALAGAAEENLPMLTPVPIEVVKIDDPFWSPKLNLWRGKSITDALDKFERDGILENFDNVASATAAKHRALPWFDGLTYEMITAAADFMRHTPDAALKKRLDGIIDHIAAAAAKDPNGYLNTYTQLNEPDHRWGQNGGNDRWQHDLYNLGCLIEAGVHYYVATGETKLLNTAVRAANHMCAVMGLSPKQNIVPGHALGEEALISLADLCDAHPDLAGKLDAKVDPAEYRRLAQFWLDARGNHQGRTDFGSYNQDHAPALKQETIEGHAVRAPLFATGMVAVGVSTAQPQYVAAARRLWTNMTHRRMYLTGGVGSFADDEKFGADFVLPNTGYAETCAAVANGFFSHRLNLAQGDANTVDELERVLYNGALAGVSLGGDRWFYENPLETARKRERWAWHGCPCCPPMFLKLMGALPGYVYATDRSGGVYVNLFIGSTATTGTGDDALTLTQTSTYPWAGDVKLTIDPKQPGRPRDLYVRLPAWARGGKLNDGLYSTTATPDAFAVTVNGKAVSVDKTERSYLKISRAWDKGDAVEIRMALPVQRVAADERVEGNRGRVALMRGPIVYCVEAVDHGGRVGDLFLPDNAPVTAEPRADLLGGVVVLKAKAQRISADGKPADAELTAIPYYANTNRGPGEMRVWIAEKPDVAAKPTIAALATPSASHVNPGDTLDALNDGATPKNSADESRHRFTWWDRRGTTEWVQYEFAAPTRVSAVSVYWWDETTLNRHCRVPQSWRLMYRKADATWSPVDAPWLPVPGNPTFGTAVDAFNTARFDALETTGLRIEVRLQPGFSGGILQWTVEAGD